MSSEWIDIAPGFKDDPATLCSYPDERNVCHAASARGGSSIVDPRRLVGGVRGRGRVLPITPGHQASMCLTAAHQQCDRYPKVPGAAPH